MPHASLLGSNGHRSTFTSEMISGQINVFIVLQKKRKKSSHHHIHNKDNRMTLTHVCLHSCAHMAPSSKCNTTTRTGCLHILLGLLTAAYVQTHTHTFERQTTKRSAPSRGQKQTLSSPLSFVRAGGEKKKC